MTAGAGRQRRPDSAQGLLGGEGGISGGGGSSGDRCWRRFANRLCAHANIGRNSASTSKKYTVRTSNRKTSDAFSCMCLTHVAVFASTALLRAVQKGASNTTRGTHSLAGS